MNLSLFDVPCVRVILGLLRLLCLRAILNYWDIGCIELLEKTLYSRIYVSEICDFGCGLDNLTNYVNFVFFLGALPIPYVSRRVATSRYHRLPASIMSPLIFQKIAMPQTQSAISSETCEPTKLSSSASNPQYF